MTPEFNTFQTIFIYAVPILFAITVHEVAHGWVANKLGDSTARMLGRLTLNPLKHIDIIGTILVPAILFLTGGFLFGWAKPVPINWQHLHHPRRDVMLVAAAGPLTNLLMALFWALVLKVATLLPFPFQAALLAAMGEVGVVINLILMVLNLIPIPPLDGSRVVSSLLPVKLSTYYESIEPFGFIILLLLLALGVLGMVLMPAVMLLKGLILGLFGL